jgi:hypothetical protein
VSADPLGNVRRKERLNYGQRNHGAILRPIWFHLSRSFDDVLEKILADGCRHRREMIKEQLWSFAQYVDYGSSMERLRVFLSSTQKDLQAERNTAEDLIKKLGHECLRAETLDSPGLSPEDTCRVMARTCDIYIGIFGPTYGFIVPHLGISATEMEYREAKASDTGKILVYVQEAIVSDIQQEKFLIEVQSFSNGYFRHEKFSSCHQLRKQLHRDIVTWTTKMVREALRKQIELRALRDKVAHMSRVMELYGVPEELR